MAGSCPPPTACGMGCCGKDEGRGGGNPPAVPHAGSHMPPCPHRIPELAWGAQGVYVCRASAPGVQAEDRATLSVQGRSDTHEWGAWAPPNLSPTTLAPQFPKSRGTPQPIVPSSQTPWYPHPPMPLGTSVPPKFLHPWAPR